MAIGSRLETASAAAAVILMMSKTCELLSRAEIIKYVRVRYVRGCDATNKVNHSKTISARNYDANIRYFSVQS